MAISVLPKLVHIAQKIGLVDQPNKRKVHTTPCPLVGGVGMVISATFAALLFVPLNGLRGFFAGLALLLLVGFLDDFKELGHKEKFLAQAFSYITHNWSGNRVNVVFQLPKLFQNDLSKLMSTKGYMYCTTMNFLLRIMAVKSGLFEDKDIELKSTNTWYIVLHQYLEIKIDDEKKILLDPWNYQFGIDYGSYGRGFDSIRFVPIR